MQAGNDELCKPQYYSRVNEDPCNSIQLQCNNLVDNMVNRGEISEKLGSYLKQEDSSTPKYYHVLKTHNIPTDIENAPQWLATHGFPVRGIISGIGGPFEKISGLVDHFLQPGMIKLPSYLQDTKHTLQIIENLNRQIEDGQLSLDGISLITLDIDKMYNNMSEELA